MVDCVKNTNYEYKTKCLRAQWAPQLWKGFAARGFPQRRCGTRALMAHRSEGRVAEPAMRDLPGRDRPGSPCTAGWLPSAESWAPPGAENASACPGSSLTSVQANHRIGKTLSGWGTSYSLLNRCIYSSPSFTLLEWHQQNTQLLQLNAQLISVYIL